MSYATAFFSILAWTASMTCIAAEGADQAAVPSPPSSSVRTLLEHPNEANATAYLIERKRAADVAEDELAALAPLTSAHLAINSAEEAQRVWPIGSAVIVGDLGIFATVLDYKEYERVQKGGGGTKTVRLLLLIQGHATEVPLAALRIHKR